MVIALSHSGLEVYKTDDVINTQHESDNSNSKTDSKSNKTNENSNSTNTNTSDDSENEGYVLQNGNITEISYYDRFYENSFEYDYEDISASGDASFPTVNQKKFYKGKRVCLKKAYNPKKWDDLKTVLLGFITEQTYSNDHVDLEISGMTKLLDKKEKFDFKQMKRSEIVKSIIEAAGLKAEIDIGDLKDDVIDYTNISSSGSGVAGGEGENIDELVSSICGSETDELTKCKLIHEWLRKNVVYKRYPCSHYNSAEECLKHKDGLNCADTARLTRAMMSSAGLKAYVVHAPNHFYCVIKINGKEYASDQTGRESPSMSGSAFNTCWHESGGRSTFHPKEYGSINGDNPSC